MQTIRKVLRFVGLVLLILLDMCGAVFAAVVPKTKEQDADNEVKTEIVEGKENEIKPQ